MSMRKLALVCFVIITVSGFAAADPPQPPAPSESNSWQGNTSIQACYANYDASTDTLEYCSEPYIQYKTKELLFCDSDNDGTHDSGERIGTWDNPEINCGWTSYGTKSVTRQFAVCGKVDEASNPDPTPQTTTVDDDEWFCPGTKALSLRHEPGDLDPGFGLAGAGYSDISSLVYTDESSPSFNLQASIPACVNRIPMLKLDVELKDDGEVVSEKTGIYASHMNLYYGPNGDNMAQLKDVELPDQEAFRKQYQPEATLKSYRMWAWRQRFADSVKTAIQEQDLSLPQNADVDQLAEQYRDTGVSVGDLWLSSDFLFGAEAGDPTGTTQIISRSVNATCSVDVRDVPDHDFESVDDLASYARENPQEAHDLLGKGGQNICNLGTNQTLSTVHEVRDSGATQENYTIRDGTFSTRVFENMTATTAAEVNVTDLGLANSSVFMDLIEQEGTAAGYALVENESDALNISLGDRVLTGADDFLNRSRYMVGMDIETTRWQTADDILAQDHEAVYSLLRGTYINETLDAQAGLTPRDRFDGWDILGVTATAENDTYSVTASFNTSDRLSSYLGFLTIGTTVREEARRSWNWRALQQLSLTELATCMYNWDQCFANNRSLADEGLDRDAQEVFDAGYGPWEGSFTFQWSQQATQQAVSQLEGLLDEGYDREIDTTFDKYFDGARGTDTVSLTPINVYRSCGQDEAWVSAGGEFYHDRAFLCPDGEATAYTCGFRAGSNVPSYVEQGSDGDVKQVNGDYYRCTVDSPGQWTLDTEPPQVSCEDCIDPVAAETGETVEISPEVSDAVSGVSSAAVCMDTDCTEIICGNVSGGCTYSSEDPVLTGLYVRATDRQGNQDTVEIGSLTIAKPIGSYCEDDDECLSGRCSSRQCLPQQIPPIIDLDIGGN